MKVPFSPPRVDQKTIDAVTEVLKSGWLTTGPKTKLFERRLTDYTGCKSTLCVNSGSAGLELVLRWFGVKEGDEVIIPAYTYAATANVVVHCGALPVMVDIDDDFNYTCECDRGHTYITNKIIIHNRKSKNTVICTVCNPLNSFSTSGYEIQLQYFIKNYYNRKILFNDRLIIKPKELDIYLPDVKLAFEFNGLYSHNEITKSKNYHLNKTELYPTGRRLQVNRSNSNLRWHNLWSSGLHRWL